MSRKALLVLAGLLIVLALVASFAWWSRYVPFSFFKAPTVSSDLNFSALTKENTNKIVINKKDKDKKVIVKKDNLWKINDFEASTAAVDDFFKAVNELKVGALVSKNPANYANFGVDEDASVLAFTQGGQTLAFVIGNQGPSPGSFYARRKDGTNVYLVTGSIPDKLSRDVSDWRDKTLVNLPKESIQKIEIISKVEPLTISKTQDGKWQAEGVGKSAPLEEGTVNRLLVAFSPLEATDFLNAAESKEFQKAGNKTTLRVYDRDQKLLAEIILLKKENDYWAQVPKKEVFYKIANHQLTDILLPYDKVFQEKSK